MQYASRKDLAHAPIKAQLAAAGFAVCDLSRVGGGCPDLLISRNGVNALVELKTPRGAKTALERLGAAQHCFHSQWKGPIITAFSASDIVYNFNMLIKRRSAYAL